MDKDRNKGAAEQAKGAVKKVAGKATGDAKPCGAAGTADVRRRVFGNRIQNSMNANPG